MWDINKPSYDNPIDAFFEPSNMTDKEREKEKLELDNRLFDSLNKRITDFRNNPDDSLREKVERIMNWLKYINYYHTDTIKNEEINNMSKKDIILSIKVYIEKVITFIEWTTTFDELKEKIKQDKVKTETEEIFSKKDIWYLKWLLEQLSNIIVKETVKLVNEWKLLKWIKINED